jgi:hypothetical protein
MMTKQLRQQMLDFGFMSNDQITLLAVATRVVEGKEVVGIYMNQQRRFPLSGPSFAQRAVRDSLVGIRIEYESVARRQATKFLQLRGGWLAPPATTFCGLLPGHRRPFGDKSHL